jgi:type I restriction enzyme S subunit
MELPELPPLPVQRRIADILGTLDDKIELNRRMNRTLEDMAQALYRHWFVDFGPFQDQPFVDSELGPIPEGWEVKTIGDVAKMRGGSTPKTSVDEYWDGGDITWFTPTDLTNSGRLYITDSSRQITEEGLNSCSTNYVPPYSLMMTSRATVGVVAFNRVRACTNQGFINVMPKDEVSWFQVYFWIGQMMPEIMARADGSTYPEISQRDFKPLPIAVPPKEVSDRFMDRVAPLFDRIESNTLESDKLAETRDYLLPKLIAGEIDFEAVQEQVEVTA